MYERLKERLIKEEGKKTRLYRDTSQRPGFENRTGKVTIGVGYNIDELGLPDDIIMMLLDRGIEKAEADLLSVFPWTSSLDEARRGVLIDMSVNLGIKKLSEFTHMLEAVASGRYSEASSHMINSLWARQVGFRATRLAEIMRTGKDE